MIIIGCDPGKATGISVVGAPVGGEPRLLGHEIIDYGVAEHGITVGEVLGWNSQRYVDHTTDLHLVVERFVPERTPHGFDATPIEVIGEIKALIRNKPLWLHQFRSITWALRVEKERVDNKVLRRLDLYLPGKEERHVNDATRHVVNRLVALSHRPTMAKGWPNE